MYLYQNPADSCRPQSKAAALGLDYRAQYVSKALHSNINLRGSDLPNITAYSSGASPTMMSNAQKHILHGYGARAGTMARRLRGSDLDVVTAFATPGGGIDVPAVPGDGIRGLRFPPVVHGMGLNLPKKIYIRRLAGQGYGAKKLVLARKLRGLGDDTGTVLPIGPGLVSDPNAEIVYDNQTGWVTNTTTGDVYDAQGNLVSSGQAAMPTQGSAAATQAAYQSVLTSAQTSKNPTDYVSPQAAIAAGLPAAQVNASWAQAMAQYPSTTAAIAAGVPAGVVTQLWAQSRNYAAAAPASWITQSTFGIPNGTLLLFGGGLLAFSMLSGSGGYRRR